MFRLVLVKSPGLMFRGFFTLTIQLSIAGLIINIFSTSSITIE